MRYTPTIFDSPAPALVGENIRLSEILSALTFALDLTEGAVPGHSLRSCLLGMRIADAIGLPVNQRASLYHALHLKDVGCSRNAAYVSALIGGDDRLLKGAIKLYDWAHPYVPRPRVVHVFWRETLPGAPISQRLKRLMNVARSQPANYRTIMELRCESGAEIVRRLDMGPAVVEAVRHFDEHWNGSGYPDGLRKEQIPLLSRICLLAAKLDLFAAGFGPARAVRMVRSRRKSWFDPDLTWAAESLASEGLLWKNCLPTDDVEDTRKAVLDLDPGLRSDLSTERLDRICEVFADVVDAKSPFTLRHSTQVTDVAQAIASELGLSPERGRIVRRAALLHDLGKLGIPNSILDKQRKLSDAEWAVVRHHPGLSGSILRRVPALRGVAMLAEEHHERLDGSGYPRRLTARDLCLESRIVALADSYAAMVERRPYREPMDAQTAIEILAADAGPRLDATCFAALEAATAAWPDSLPSSEQANPTHENDSTRIPLWTLTPDPMSPKLHRAI